MSPIIHTQASMMLFPYIVDCYATCQVMSQRKLVKQPNRKPKEEVCQYSFTSDYQFVRMTCSVTMRMELETPGSSSIFASLNGNFMYEDGPLPTSPDDMYSEAVLTEYVVREIYHSCVLDKEQNGPFCFLYKIVNYIRKIMDPVTKCELTKDIKQKIFDLLRSVIPETSRLDMTSLLTGP